MARKNTKGLAPNYSGIEEVSNMETKEVAVLEVNKEVVAAPEKPEVNKEIVVAPEKPVEKKKTNRGRKRKYEEGEVVKLSVLVDKDLSTMLKNAAKRKGKTVISVMTPYVEKWIKENEELQNPYYDSTNKKYTGFNVTPELRTLFADACTDREISQSFVMESLYQKALDDFHK